MGVGGADRSVYVIDINKFSTRGIWRNALKYEITSLHFSTIDSDLCILSGLDSEVVCGKWAGGNKASSHYQHGTRADSRWIGTDLHPETDLFVGITQLGTLYRIANVTYLYPVTPKKKKATHQIGDPETKRDSKRLKPNPN